MKTALIYDWLVAKGGGEKVLEAIHSLYPSPVYTLLGNQKLFPQFDLKSSFIQKLPRAQKWYRNYLPLFPLAIEQFDLREHELIISTSHAVAKGVMTNAHQLHICYCFTPMRYAWDLTHHYLDDVGGFKRALAQFFLHYIRGWDVASSHRVDHFAAISHFVAQRIYKIYRREAKVIYPPVATHLFKPAEKKEDFYLTVSRLVPYKRIDLIVEAFSHMPDKKLVVIGDGPEMKKIKAKATKNVEILGFQSEERVRHFLSLAKAFIFAAEEDFGIAPVEAQASGTPVIAFGKGGALETVKENETGLFFSAQTVNSLLSTFHSFEKTQDKFDPRKCIDNAKRFGEERFKIEFQGFITQKVVEFHESHHSRRR